MINKEEVTFCSGCFATNEDGSWGSNGWEVNDIKNGGAGYCMNCGGHGEILIMSRYSADSIRKQASWIGKRYYPIQEDFWNQLSINIWKYKTIFLRFKVENSEVFPRKLGLFTWSKKRDEKEASL